MRLQTSIQAVAVAGRRYPWAAAGRVREALERHLSPLRRATLVSSAAAGVDLVALALARELGMARRIVLPSDPASFRKASVIDRGEEWGPLFDELAVEPDVIAMPKDLRGLDPYLAANEEILDEALQAATEPAAVLALVVWDGERRSTGTDYTDSFLASARRRGFRVVEEIVALRP